MRGYFGIGIYHTKTPVNIGTLWRSANLFGASFVFTIGRRYEHQASDTMKTPRHVPLYHYQDFAHFQHSRPSDAKLIGIEMGGGSIDIGSFCHPERAVYLLGAEDHGLPAEVIAKCQHVVHIDTSASLNVAVAGSIVLFHRDQQKKVKGSVAA